MSAVVGQLLFKTSLISFLTVMLWGMLNDMSFEQVILRAAVSALAVYFIIIIYISGIRMILRSDTKKEKSDDVQTT